MARVCSRAPFATCNCLLIAVLQGSVSSRPQEFLRLLRELTILRLIDHPNIVKIIDVFPPVYSRTGQLEQLYIVFEFAGESLHQFLVTSHTHDTPFTDLEAGSIMKQMLAATGYLHRCRVIHRDLKPDNVLVHRQHDGSLSVKLADFGLCREFFEFDSSSSDLPSIFQRSMARSLSGGTRPASDLSAFDDEIQSAELQTAIEIAASSAGVHLPSEIFDGDDMVQHPLSRQLTAETVTEQYRAPEIFMSDGYYDQAVDVWSLGCILYDMMFCMRLNEHQRRLIANGKLKTQQSVYHRNLFFCSKKLFAVAGCSEL
jgi:serine/threonine protein kinase